MASEIRVDKINSLSGVGTVTLSPTGVDISGITTAATLKATTGIVTTLTATTGIVTNFTANAVNIGIDTGVYGEDLVVTGNARVTGITTFGTSDNPAAMLNIDDSSGTSTISIPDSIIHSGDTDTKIRFPAADTITAETGGSERVRITSAGLMGIGTNSPDNILHLESSSNTYLQIEKTGTSSKVYLGNVSGEGILEATAGAIKLKPNGASNKFILDTSGNLTLGAASYQNGGFGGSSHGINIAGTQPQILLHETDTDKDGYFGLAGSILRIQTADSIPVTIWTNDTKRINVHETTGDTTIETGNLIMGTSGKGISFAATGDGGSTTPDSEILNDYEEGTWNASSLNYDYDGNQAQRGFYIRIGKMVFAYYRVKFHNQSTYTGQHLRWTALPFTADSGSPQDIVVGAHAHAYSHIDFFRVYVQPASTYAYWYTETGSNFNNSTSLNNKDVRGCIMYKAA